MEKTFEKQQHETMVRALSDYLRDKGYSIKIEPNTKEYAGIKADIEAIKGKENLCFEVVNGEDIDTPQTKKKWEAISGNRNCEFCLFVPENKESIVKALLDKWAIYFRKLLTYSAKAI
jgi:hypothetical protein